MNETQDKIQQVVVVDVKMKFSSMVALLVTLAIASIPAAIIIAIIWFGISAIFVALFSMA